MAQNLDVEGVPLPARNHDYIIQLFIMNRSVVLLTTLLSFGSLPLFAQFHTMRIPQPSNFVQETQRLAVTDITITYHSPAVRERDVWNDGTIPQNGDPIPWRAGANMNTTIAFSTDVLINGEALAAGTYGFHVIPRGDTFTLMFAHNNNQWGSYYLNVEEDVTLQVDVDAEECTFSEKLDYEFFPSGEDAMIVGLEWAERRLPFTVSVDLNETVLNSFRSELRGINTYRWQAWNDAARWCLNHDANLEEALAWANRSIEGGYGGFAADMNITNLSTKVELLTRLGQTAEIDPTIDQMMALSLSAYETNSLSRLLLNMGRYQATVDACSKALVAEPNTWFLQLNQGIALYFLSDTKQALTLVKQAQENGPERFQERLKEIEGEIADGSYKLPGQ